MWLLQENNMEIDPNMLNNIFIALRTPQSPRLLHKTHLVCQHFARLHAPCAQMPQERFLHSVHRMPCRGQQQREAVEQNADAVGKSYPAVEESSHGIYVLFHGFLRARGVGWA